MISDALDVNLISRIVGYKLIKGDFSTTSPNLPQIISVFAEANTANQATLDLTPTQLTSSADAATKYGYGSPIYQIMRILFPQQGGGASVPVKVYPIAEAAGATSKKLVITPTGTATANGTHTVVLSGRDGLDGVFYNVNIAIGDTPTAVSQKIIDAVNAVLGAPAIGTLVTTTAVLESKWKGLTAQEMNVSINTNGNSLGMTYAYSVSQAATGTPSIASTLDLIGNSWDTIVINGFGTHTQTLTALETFNGKPDPTNPTGRFAAPTMKPIIALTGSVADNDASLCDAHLDDVTIAICPAPLSLGFSFEAAANMAVLFGNNSSNNPHLDIEGQSYPDMPTPASIGTMAVYANRDLYVKKGNSTVDLVSGRYQVQDFVTTYHKAGENPPQFRYCRDLVVDFNIRYAYLLKEQIHVVDHVIAADADIVSATNVVKPKQWKAVLSSELIPDLAKRALIADVAFSKASIQVSIGTSNPNRFETAFSYKRTGTARVISTTVKAGFNFGTI